MRQTAHEACGCRVFVNSGGWHVEGCRDHWPHRDPDNKWKREVYHRLRIGCQGNVWWVSLKAPDAVLVTLYQGDSEDVAAETFERVRRVLVSVAHAASESK